MIGKTKIHSQTTKILADVLTPVSIYLKLRDQFPNSCLLESSDYHARENSHSYIACSPLAEFKVENELIIVKHPDGTSDKKSLADNDLKQELIDFCASFEPQKAGSGKILKSALFGYTSYEAVQYFENIQLDGQKNDGFDIPLMHYIFFEYVIAFDHFSNTIHLTQNSIKSIHADTKLDDLISIITTSNTPEYNFEQTSDIVSDTTDDEYRKGVEKAIAHCKRGDVIQMVLSKNFKTKFIGDEFLVYRTLRSINPSPYLFYFDYGSFKIFGSSPEAQLVVDNGTASIFPIAGTYRRSGDDQEDAEAARRLYEDEKENSEHVMLVDLARNDLSKSGTNVTVEKFKDTQFFSHVIHLVSKVTAKMNVGKKALDIAADTFPAGTLSGAPKYRAMQLIDEYEKNKRGYYGGMIGLMDFEGNFNHAILIRSFLSQNNTLHFQAGAGIVAKSKPDDELQEVYNKIGALKSAIDQASKINQKETLPQNMVIQGEPA